MRSQRRPMPDWYHRLVAERQDWSSVPEPAHEWTEAELNVLNNFGGYKVAGDEYRAFLPNTPNNFSVTYVEQEPFTIVLPTGARIVDIDPVAKPRLEWTIEGGYTLDGVPVDFRPDIRLPAEPPPRCGAG